MAYVDYAYYKGLYGEESIDESTFNRLCWEACRKVDNMTSGVDDVKKLKAAFPTDEDAAESVKRCVCKVIELAHDIETARKSISKAQEFVTREDGNLQGKVVSSVSAGNESISFISNTAVKTVIDKAVGDAEAEKQLYVDTIREYLSGVQDANGVNLLYMGPYPYR